LFLSWYFIAFIAIRKAVVYECCPAVFPFVLFTIQIRRRTLYYVVNVVGKLIKNFLSCLTSSGKDSSCINKLCLFKK
jgi:hypothetical protein